MRTLAVVARISWKSVGTALGWIGAAILVLIVASQIHWQLVGKPRLDEQKRLMRDTQRALGIRQ